MPGKYWMLAITVVSLMIFLVGCSFRVVESTSSSSLYSVSASALLPDPCIANSEELVVGRVDDQLVLSTPYYSVSLNDNEWSYEYYGDDVQYWSADGGAMKGHQLNLSKGGAVGGDVHIYVTSTDWTGIQGTYLIEVIGTLPGWENYQVVIAVPGEAHFEADERQHALLEEVLAGITMPR